MVRWKSTTGASVVGVAIVMVAIAGCAAQEMSGAEEAVAVAPAEEGDGDGINQAGPAMIESDGPGEFSFSVRAAPADYAVADLGMISIDEEEQLARCESIGDAWTASFDVAAADLVVRSCCDRGGFCLTTLTFVDHGTHLAMTGQQIKAVDISPDGHRITLVGAATSGSGAERALAIAEVDQLRQLARAVDEAPPVVEAEERGQIASWVVPADDVHALESLSARALDEAAEPCEEGHHLPTLLALAAQGAPISDHLDLFFERWLPGGELLVSTAGDEPGATVMVVDPRSQCMVRLGAVEEPQEIAATVHVPQGFRWDLFRAQQITVGDETRQVIVGLVSQQRGPDRLDRPFEMGVLVDHDDQAMVVKRGIGAREIYWWLLAGADPAVLTSAGISDPVQRFPEAWRQTVTIVIDGHLSEEDAIDVELYPHKVR